MANGGTMTQCLAVDYGELDFWVRRSFVLENAIWYFYAAASFQLAACGLETGSITVVCSRGVLDSSAQIMLLSMLIMVVDWFLLFGGVVIIYIDEVEPLKHDTVVFVLVDTQNNTSQGLAFEDRLVE